MTTFPYLVLFSLCAAGTAVAGPPPPDDDGPVTATERKKVVDTLAATLDAHYVFADRAKAIDKLIHEHLRRGDYDKLASGQAFATRLTGDIAALVHDPHLDIRYSKQPLPAGDERDHAGDAADEAYLNHGIFDVRRMRFDIGYLDINEFASLVPTAEKLGAALRLLHDTRALIVDLRNCHGGDTDTVPVAASYLLPAGTHLLDMYTRSTNTTDRIYAKADLAGPHYAADRPVFILIGGDTASGCESFAYMMQAQKRATLIGEHTAGAAHFGDPKRLSDHFMAFIPIGRPIDPITHGDWEGTGVLPDVAAAAPTALDVAERKSLEWLAPREASPQRKDAMQKRLGELK